jgi:PAS domain-containing protein
VSKAKGQPKDLILIVAREFASRLATAVLVTDADGTLVYFNEPAERLLARTFAETGELPVEEWVSMVPREELDGSPLPADRLPSRMALHERRPAHHEFVLIVGGVRHEISATAFPLLSSERAVVGVFSVFWEREPGEGQHPA